MNRKKLRRRSEGAEELKRRWEYRRVVKSFMDDHGEEIVREVLTRPYLHNFGR